MRWVCSACPVITGYHGLINIGEPKAGDTVVVAAATGAVGSVVGQVAKLKGCRVVGIAGGADKCAYATAELGFDACVDHQAPNLRELLKAQCPRGIDVYFENVGGAVFSAVLPLLNVGARVPVCGLIALYNATSLPAGPDLSGLLMRAILVNRLRVQGFIISDHYGAPYSAFVREMSGWLASGQVRYREHVVEGAGECAARVHRPDARRQLRQGDRAAGRGLSATRRLRKVGRGSRGAVR